MHDLIEGIDRTYPTLADRNHRAIAGISMGGHGALRFAFAYPEWFTAVAALSPAIWKSDGVSWALSPQFATEDAFEKWFPRITGETFDAATFHSQSPFAMIGNLRSLTVVPRIMLTVGDDDYWKLHDGTVELYLDLRSHGLDPELRVADGAHNWRHWRAMIDPVLLFISRDWYSAGIDGSAPITQ